MRNVGEKHEGQGRPLRNSTAPTACGTDFFRQPPHRYLSVNGGELAYRRVGTGPDVLFFHGWPVSSATYRHLVPLLSSQVTCHFIDFLGAGQSRFRRSSEISMVAHIDSARSAPALLGLQEFSVVGHDSGGLIARHAFADHPGLRSMVLLNTEQPHGIAWPFRQLLLLGKLPGIGHLLAWALNQRRLRRTGPLLGGCFADLDLLDGEFEEFFLTPLREDSERRWAAGRGAATFDTSLVKELIDVHERIRVPVQLIWGDGDPFFPLHWAESMVGTFENARLHVVSGAKLFCHEERPEEVAAAMLPTLLHGHASPPER